MNKTFSLTYASLVPSKPELGTVAVIPWDTDVFGFPVGDYRPGEAAVAAGHDVDQALRDWVRSERVRMVSCFTPASDLAIMPILSRVGFHFIELGMRATLPNLAKAPLPRGSDALRAAEAADCSGIESIAATSFQAGRYNADPLVSRDISARRLVQWTKRALSGTDPADEVLVLGPFGDPTCFFHLRRDGDSADLRLAAVKADLQGGGLGYRLYASVLTRLRDKGVRRAIGRFSATNTPVLNLYASSTLR